MRLVDSHCHLQAERFDADRDEVIERARLAGVERILVPGWDLPSSAAAIDLVSSHAWLDAAAGIHPHDAARADAAAWLGIDRLARDHRVVAVGETGLDFDRMFSPEVAQLDNLRRHLELGLDVAKPVILHCRSAAGSTAAHDAMLAALDEAGIRVGTTWRRPPAVLHSFSGPASFAEQALSRGLSISISGLAFRAGEEATLGEVAALAPSSRLLVETDAPYLSPPSAPRRRNEPEWVRATAEAVARARGEADGAFGRALVAAYDATFRALIDGRATGRP
ncbi:MAG TPA: TatD family hydrolase [Candidatus Limnocylindrales bacterium]|nr:TatD family hydrolase [Candidatus Limnocylindrales bacterium]